MTQIACTSSLPDPPPSHGGRVRRLTHRLAPVLAPAILVAGLGCREDAESPTAPEPGPALATTASAALTFREVSAGGLHTCGVTSEDQAYCWGYNNYGQLGVGTTDGPELCLSLGCSTRPVAVLGGLRFRQVSAGEDHTCGITTDYLAYCWGLNYNGQLGDGTTIYRSTPVAVAGGLHFRQASAGHAHTCGLTTDNRAYCWGYNGDGALGNGTNTGPETGPYGTYSSRPVAVLGTLAFRQVSSGGSHTCGVTTDNRAFCWGRNGEGQLGDSTGVRRLGPSPVAGTRHWRQVDAGFLHTCGVTMLNRAFCWGNGRDGELGNGKTYLSFWPRAVSGGLSFERVTAGDFHSCGETATNRAYCWGGNRNNYGQLGDGTTIGRLTPVAVKGGLYFSEVSAGGYHTCGKTSAGVGYCWGYNGPGQLGDGSRTNRLRPRAVVGPS
jgi:alpha-tubulin suppressor-like RCC1 family protein